MIGRCDVYTHVVCCSMSCYVIPHYTIPQYTKLYCVYTRTYSFRGMWSVATSAYFVFMYTRITCFVVSMLCHTTRQYTTYYGILYRTILYSLYETMLHYDVVFICLHAAHACTYKNACVHTCIHAYIQMSTCMWLLI